MHEKDSKLDCNNYGPISLLSNIEKILEKLVYNRITEFLNDNNNLIYLTGYARAWWRKSWMWYFCRPSKSLWHILLAKLDFYGICGVANYWFRSYLCYRRQFVSINEFNSNHSMLKNVKTWLSLMKQQLRSKLKMNWNEKFWKTSVKDYPM